MLSQVRTLLDAVTCSSLLKVVKTLAAPSPSNKKAQQQAATDEHDDMDIDTESTEPDAACSQAVSTKTKLLSCAVIVKNVAALLQSFGLRDQPDNMRAIVDTLVDVTRHVTTGRPADAAASHALHSEFEIPFPMIAMMTNETVLLLHVQMQSRKSHSRL